jgi:hypothetical protein
MNLKPIIRVDKEEEKKRFEEIKGPVKATNNYYPRIDME